MDSEHDVDRPDERRLKEIEARLARIENRLGILRPVSGSHVPRSPAPEASVPPAKPAAPPAVITGPTKPRIDLERLLGERVIAWVGALIVVAGVGLFVKLAYDQGWLRFPPVARCALGAGFGMALLLVGEFLRRRVSAVSGAGSFAAGIGTLFASTLAAYELYQLLPLFGAFVLLAAIAALGVAISIRSGLVSVGGVGFLCAYLTPMVLWSDIRSPYLLPAYLLLVLASCIVIARRGPNRHALARWVGWAGTLTLGSAWVLESVGDSLVTPCVFLGVAWAMVQADLFLSSSRSADAAKGIALARRGHLSFAMTTWCALLSLWVVAEMDAAHDWLAPASLAAICLPLGVLARIRARRAIVEGADPSSVMATSFLSQAGGLALLAIGVGLSGPALPLTWLSLGVASALAARRARDRSLAVYAVLAIGLASVNLVVYEPLFGDLASNGKPFRGLVLSTWALCVWAACVAWIATALLLTRLPSRVLRVGLGIGPALAYASVLHEDADSSSIAWAWILLSLLWLASARLIGRLSSIWVCAVGAAIAIIPWTMSFAGRQWFVTDATLGFHEGLLSALLLGSVLILCARRAGATVSLDKARRLQLSVACVAIAIAVVLAATSHEGARIAGVLSGSTHARAAAVSIWWAVFGAALIAIGFLRSIAGIRHAGLALLYVAGAKIVLYDFSHISPSWRIAGFVGVGLLMLLVGIGYARLSRVMERAESRRGEPDHELI